MRSRGVLYMTLSAFGFSIMAVLVKVVSPRIPTGEIVLARALFTLVLSYAMVRRAALAPLGNERGKLLLRGLFGFGALGSYYLAIAHLPLAEATTLQFTQPLITSLLAWRLLGERIGWGAVVAIVCGLAGVTLVVHPGVPLGAGADPFGVTCALLSAVMAAMAYVTVRQLAGTENPLVIVLYFPLVAAPLSIPWAAFNFVWPSATDWLALVGIGISTQFGQVYMTRALAIDVASRVTAAGYIQIAFAVLWQLIVFGQWPAVGTVLGAGLVIAGTLAVSATSTSAATTPRKPT